MGFVASLFTGAPDQFQATAPVNQFQAGSPDAGDFRTALMRSMGQQGSVFGQQQGLANSLQAQAAGNGPSVAQPMLQQATEANQNMAAGQIASVRGQNAGLAARQIGQQRAGIQQGSALQAALLRNQEQLGAQGMLGQTLGNMGAQSLGTMGTAGGLLNQQVTNEQQLNQATSAQNANLNLGAQQINAGVQAQNAQFQGQIVGGLLSGAGAAAGHAAGHAAGGMIPGRAAVPGDSAANDTVDAELSPGEIVIPRSVAQSEDAPELAEEFVRAVRRKHYAQGGGAYAEGGQVPQAGYGKVLAITRSHEKRLAQLEAKIGAKKAGGKK